MDPRPECEESVFHMSDATLRAARLRVLSGVLIIYTMLAALFLFVSHGDDFSGLEIAALLFLLLALAVLEYFYFSWLVVKRVKRMGVHLTSDEVCLHGLRAPGRLPFKDIVGALIVKDAGERVTRIELSDVSGRTSKIPMLNDVDRFCEQLQMRIDDPSVVRVKHEAFNWLRRFLG